MVYAPTEGNMLIRIPVYLKVICIFKFHVITIGRTNVAADFFTRANSLAAEFYISRRDPIQGLLRRVISKTFFYSGLYSHFSWVRS